MLWNAINIFSIDSHPYTVYVWICQTLWIEQWCRTELLEQANNHCEMKPGAISEIMIMDEIHDLQHWNLKVGQHTGTFFKLK